MTPNLMLMMLLRVVMFGIGLFVVVATLISAIKTFVVPRGLNVRLTSAIFWLVSAVFRMRNKRAKSYHERDQTMALFAPVTLIVLPIAFLTLILLGYAAMYWALELMPLSEAMRLSGSSLLTLGYASVEKPTIKFLEFSEAMLGLVLVALLVAYLPTMYAAFSRRETAVALLEGYAGAPPSAAEFVSRMGRNQELENLRGFWETWQIWFAELEESHTSLAPLAFFRSPQPERSWVTAAGTVLDAAALMLSAVDTPWEAKAALCIRSGYLALNQIAAFFGMETMDEVQPNDPISISRAEFDEVYERLVEEGLPLVDQEQAWRDYRGWRVNYDMVLLELAAFTMAPYAAWSSDRSALPRPEPAASLLDPDNKKGQHPVDAGL